VANIRFVANHHKQHSGMSPSTILGKWDVSKAINQLPKPTAQYVHTYVHKYIYIYILVGGFNPSEKYQSVGMMTFPIYGKA